MFVLVGKDDSDVLDHVNIFKLCGLVGNCYLLDGCVRDAIAANKKCAHFYHRNGPDYCYVGDLDERNSVV